VAGEQVLVAVRAGVVAEVGRRSPEGPISDGMNVDVTDQHWSPRDAVVGRCRRVSRDL
jgi:hypothetical protein